MTRPDLLKKLEGMLVEAESTRLFGNIEIEIKGGIPCIVRLLKTEKIGDFPNERNKQPYR